MVRHWTESELQAELKKLTVIIDGREKVNYNILGYLEDKKIPHIERKLDVGDYAVQIGAQTFEHSFAVERKANLDELCGNMTGERDRFEREFLRAQARGTRLFLLIENASWADVLAHNYQSKMSSNSLLASLLSWQARFDVTVAFARPEDSPRLLWGLLYYSAREELLWGRR